MFRESTNSYMPLQNLSISPQAEKAISGSRAKAVGDVLYPAIDEAKFAPLFSEIGSRPNIPILRYVCALILERMYGLSDHVFLELLRSGALNFQYALHTCGEESQPLSESSLRRFRRSIWLYNAGHGCDLIKEEFLRISKMMAVDMGVFHDEVPDDGEDGTPDLIRMDSMLIEAHAKVMTRLEILYTSNALMIRYLIKKGFGMLVPAELSHYTEEGDRNRVVYYRVDAAKKALEQDSRVAKTIHEMELLDNALRENLSPAILAASHEYQVFLRVLDEQSYIGPDGSRVPRDKKDISPSSVQNPYDETVTYRFKGGQHHGSVLNVVEAYGREGGDAIIVHADVEPNTASDAQMAAMYFNSLPDGGPKQQVAADGAYGGMQLDALARSKGAVVTNTCLSGKQPDPFFAGFTISESGDRVLSCPEGKEPASCQYNPKTGCITSKMPDNCCAGCPNRERCKAHVNNKKRLSTVKVTDTKVRLAAKSAYSSSAEGKESAHQRNAIEGTMGVMRRKYLIDHIPVFGLIRAKIWIWASLLAYNLVKYQKYLARKGSLPAAA